MPQAVALVRRRLDARLGARREALAAAAEQALHFMPERAADIEAALVERL